MNMRKFKLSCKYFAGFSCYVDLDNHDSMETIITEVVNKLRKILKENNLQTLCHHLDKINYHYHDYTFADTLMKSQTFYLCNHCDIINLSI